ncbi:LytTR family DNA-binding domain-containing protein [Pedobacter frigoris]|uniref:LytR/AlgR family response regulator transcription factor n=1 Tax=Pedobacter frigoris TaxID=2571272 RepID=UPI002930DF96|nr:LytTR family DNA-binding domain-containing protein [Pedobacter frigoris]
MIRTIAIDDEPVALEIIKTHASKVPFLHFLGGFTEPSEALTILHNDQIDLVFLDIQMPDISGLDMVRLIGKKTQIIFTTAFSDYAVKAFDLAITDYLLKPIGFSRFLQSCQLAKERVSLLSSQTNEATKQLFVKDGYQWVRIDLDQLLFIQGQDNYVRLCESGKQTLTRMTLSDLIGQLPTNEFIRVEKSFIVAISKIDRIEKHQLIIGTERIPVSQAYRINLIERLKNFMPYSGRNVKDSLLAPPNT